MKVFFSRITGNYAELPVRRSNQLADPDGEHRLLWDFFDSDPSEDRSFLYRRLSSSSKPSFLTVSEKRPSNTVNGFSVEVKPYDPAIDKGDEYRFSVRVNSTIKSNGSYHDIVMNRKHQLKQ
ncbi:MAG: type I-E CRISPR-associated protein Cas6/Cse3/CasE, partial [bacterium]